MSAPTPELEPAIRTQPMMLATQLLKGINARTPGLQKLSDGTDQITVEGLTALSMTLANELARRDGISFDEVLDRVHDTSLLVVRAGGETS